MKKVIEKVEIKKINKKTGKVVETITLDSSSNMEESMKFAEEYMDSLWFKFKNAKTEEEANEVMHETAAFLVHLGKECNISEDKIRRMIAGVVNTSAHNFTRTIQ